MPQIVVAVPVRNEAEHIQPLLNSLAAQRGAPPFAVVLLLNNCTDSTASIVRTMAPGLPFAVHSPQRVLVGAEASAGTARRLAMEHAAALAGPDGILLTTDADATLPPDWIAANLAELSAGADAVAGCAVIDPVDEARLPRQMRDDEDRVQYLTTLLDQIEWVIDPDPADPWPRHCEHSGASIAVTVAAWQLAGGIPAVPSGEDRAFFAALRAVDARIRHARTASVIVSGRLHGRAAGGMADTMRRRITQPDAWLDDPVEPAADRQLRAYLRRSARHAWRNKTLPPELPATLDLAPDAVAAALQSERFGAAWEVLETGSAILARQLVAAADRESEIAQAEAILTALQAVAGDGEGSTLDEQGLRPMSRE